MLTATGLVESWDQTPVGPAVDEREKLPIDLSGPHWDTPPLPEWIDPAAPFRHRAYTPLDGSRVAPLDGMRAFAVTAVILYHANPSWAVGGYFGVDVFFVLSGFLITTLLLGEWRGSGGVGLRAFWGRRARRLLPALFVMLAVVGSVSVLAPGCWVRQDSSATPWPRWATWPTGTSSRSTPDYFATVANPSPLQHTWTLAIEEQFYLLWPLVLLVLVGGFRRLRRPSGAAVGAAWPWWPEWRRPERRPRRWPWLSSPGRGHLGEPGRTTAATPGPRACWSGPPSPPCACGGDRCGPALGRRLLGVVGLARRRGRLVMWRTVPESSALTFHGGFAPAGPGHGRGDRLRHPAGPASGGRTPLPAPRALPGEDLLRHVPLVLAGPAGHDVAADPPPGRGPPGGPTGGHRGRGGPLLPLGRVPDPPGSAGRLAIVGGRPAGGPGRLAAPPPDAVRLGRGGAGDVVPPVASKAALARAATPGPVAGAVRPPTGAHPAWWATRWPAPSGWASPPWPRSTAPRS